MYENSLYNVVFNEFKFNESLLDTPIPQLTSVFEGILYASFGAISIVIYFPFFIAILDKKNFQFPCYKIMASIAFFDIINLFILGIVAGIWSILGLNYWTNPFGSIFICDMGYFIFCATTGELIILAIQRCTQIISPQVTDLLFAGKLTYVWLMIPIVITFAMIVVHPVIIYSSVLNVCVLDPYVGYPNQSTVKYESIYRIMENFGNTVILIAIYFIFFVVLIFKKKQNNKNLDKKDSQNFLLFIQTAVICLVTLISNFLYITETYIQIPQFAITLTELATLLVHAIPPVIFLLFNKTLKNTIRGYFSNKIINDATLIKTKSVSIRILPAPIKII
uniref:G_PROTEIN_RECEP_F1_2 domain-containing protein n=1 Tax=Rhabditophanes sp. KR3021 TaxID=114890 RepID=A0AC35UG22_9BILA